MDYIRRLFILVIAFQFFSRVHLFYCYTCNAIDNETCNKTQTIKKCSSINNNCVTMSYSYEYLYLNQLKEMHVFRKFCSPTQFSCDWLCRSTEESGNKNCKAACCQSNICNQPINEQEIFHGLRNDSRLLKRDCILISLFLLLNLLTV